MSAFDTTYFNMAAATVMQEFDSWLSKKLLQLNEDTDLDVFVQYITSILETETDVEEQKESILDLLGQIAEDDLEDHCSEITSKYEYFVGESSKAESKGATDILKAQLESALEKHSSDVVKNEAKPLTEAEMERRKAKEAILQQFSTLSSGEEEDDVATKGDAESLSSNMNAKLVLQRQVAEREKNKQDHERKKQKDKEDREKQKQKQQDRKDAERKRTQKGERRA